MVSQLLLTHCWGVVGTSTYGMDFCFTGGAGTPSYSVTGDLKKGDAHAASLLQDFDKLLGL